MACVHLAQWQQQCHARTWRRRPTAGGVVDRVVRAVCLKGLLLWRGVGPRPVGPQGAHGGAAGAGGLAEVTLGHTVHGGSGGLGAEAGVEAVGHVA